MNPATDVGNKQLPTVTVNVTSTGGPITGIDHLEVVDGTARAAIVERPDGRRGRISFRHVFVCGGAIQTPALLQRSRIRGRIGASLAVHPTVKLAARFREPINVDDDVPVHQVTEFFPYTSFGGSASQAGLLALALNDNWRALMRFQLERAREWFARSEAGVRWLAPDARWPVWASLRLYRGILDVIEQHQYDVFNKRAYVPKAGKLLDLPFSYLVAQVR